MRSTSSPERWAYRKALRRLLLTVPLALCATAAFGQTQSRATRISTDGSFADWRNVQRVHRDRLRDNAGRLDFRRLWITNDEESLHVRIEVGAEIIIQDDNELTIYLDVDDNPSTGLSYRGIGAELRWTFGARQGVLFMVGGDSATLEYQHIGLITAPTVSSKEFEIVFSRTAEPVPGELLFPGPTIRVAFADGPGGDVLPNDSGGVRYTFSYDSLPPVLEIDLAKQNPNHLRVMAFNPNNGMFRPDRAAANRRVFGAIGPDLLVLTEIRDHTSQEAMELVAPLIPSPRTGVWYHAKAGAEANVVVSPFPVLRTLPLGNSAAFFLDAAEAYDTQLLVISLSAPSGRQNAERQHEFDMIASFVRDAKSPGGQLDLEPNTPMVLIGDANLVGFAQQRRTLLSGDIVNTDEFGLAAAPDWDGSRLADLIPRHTHRPVTFTWYGDSFSPGRLDHVIYSDAVLDVANRFVLFTAEMPDAALMRYGLQRDDTRLLGNHLPVVADFVFRRWVGQAGRR